RGGRLHGVVRQKVAHRQEAAGQRGGNLRPVTGQRLGNVLVGRPLPRPLGVELGVILVGANERVRQRFGQRRRAYKQEDEQDAAKKRPKQPSRDNRGPLRKRGDNATNSTVRHAHSTNTDRYIRPGSVSEYSKRAARPATAKRDLITVISPCLIVALEELRGRERVGKRGLRLAGSGDRDSLASNNKIRRR